MPKIAARLIHIHLILSLLCQPMLPYPQMGLPDPVSQSIHPAQCLFNQQAILPALVSAISPIEPADTVIVNRTIEDVADYERSNPAVADAESALRLLSKRDPVRWWTAKELQHEFPEIALSTQALLRRLNRRAANSLTSIQKKIGARPNQYRWLSAELERKLERHVFSTIRDKAGTLDQIRRMSWHTMANRLEATGLSPFASEGQALLSASLGLPIQPLFAVTSDAWGHIELARLMISFGGLSFHQALNRFAHYPASFLPMVYNPEIRDAGIYYAPFYLQIMQEALGLQTPLKSWLAHEVGEMMSSQWDVHDPVLSRMMSDGHAVVWEIEMRFAALLGEAELAICRDIFVDRRLPLLNRLVRNEPPGGVRQHLEDLIARMEYLVAESQTEAFHNESLLLWGTAPESRSAAADESQQSTRDQDSLLGRNSSGMSVLDFTHVPADVIFDRQTQEWNLSLLDEMIQGAASRLSAVLHVPVKAAIVGGMRYLQSGRYPDRKDLDIIVAADSPVGDSALEELFNTAFLDELGAVQGHLQGTAPPKREMQVLFGPESRRPPLHVEVFGYPTVESAIDFHWLGINLWLFGNTPEKVAKAIVTLAYDYGDDNYHTLRQQYLDEGMVAEDLGQSLVDRFMEDGGVETLVQQIMGKFFAPVRPFNVEIDVHEEDTALTELCQQAMRLIEDTQFPNKAARINLLKQLVDHRRITYADHLPGLFRAQRMPSGEFRILVNRSVRWLIDGVRDPSSPWSQEQRQSVIAFIGAKLLHEVTEILLSTEENVHWELGENDHALVTTETEAYQAEIQFLSQIPDFLPHFRPLLRGNPPLVKMYENALGATAAQQRAAIHALLTELGYDTQQYNTQHSGRLQVHLRRHQQSVLQHVEQALFGIGTAGRNADSSRNGQFPTPGKNRISLEDAAKIAGLPKLVISEGFAEAWDHLHARRDFGKFASRLSHELLEHQLTGRPLGKELEDFPHLLRYCRIGSYRLMLAESSDEIQFIDLFPRRDLRAKLRYWHRADMAQAVRVSVSPGASHLQEALIMAALQERMGQSIATGDHRQSLPLRPANPDLGVLDQLRDRLHGLAVACHYEPRERIEAGIEGIKTETEELLEYFGSHATGVTRIDQEAETLRDYIELKDDEALGKNVWGSTRTKAQEGIKDRLPLLDEVAECYPEIYPEVESIKIEFFRSFAMEQYAPVLIRTVAAAALRYLKTQGTTPGAKRKLKGDWKANNWRPHLLEAVPIDRSSPELYMLVGAWCEYMAWLGQATPRDFAYQMEVIARRLPDAITEANRPIVIDIVSSILAQYVIPIASGQISYPALGQPEIRAQIRYVSERLFPQRGPMDNYVSFATAVFQEDIRLRPALEATHDARRKSSDQYYDLMVLSAWEGDTAHLREYLKETRRLDPEFTGQFWYDLLDLASREPLTTGRWHTEVKLHFRGWTKDWDADARQRLLQMVQDESLIARRVVNKDASTIRDLLAQERELIKHSDETSEEGAGLFHRRADQQRRSAA